MTADPRTHYPATEAARKRRLEPRLFVGSETGALRRVILHRPDLELKRLTPRNKDALLFDDVLWVRRARQEHDAFADALADRLVPSLEAGGNERSAQQRAVTLVGNGSGERGHDA